MRKGQVGSYLVVLAKFPVMVWIPVQLYFVWPQRGSVELGKYDLSSDGNAFEPHRRMYCAVKKVRSAVRMVVRA